MSSNDRVSSCDTASASSARKTPTRNSSSLDRASCPSSGSTPFAAIDCALPDSVASRRSAATTFKALAIIVLVPVDKRGLRERSVSSLRCPRC